VRAEGAVFGSIRRRRKKKIEFDGVGPEKVISEKAKLNRVFRPNSQGGLEVLADLRNLYCNRLHFGKLRKSFSGEPEY
jgi:hypothetical protein